MLTMFWFQVALFIILLGFSGFFSSSETSLFSLTDRQLRAMKEKGHKRAKLVERLVSEPRRLIITILIGNELVNVSATAISASLVIELLGADNKFANLFIMVPLLLLFGEITPKTLAIRNNVGFAAFQAPFIDRFARLITPLRRIVRKVADWCITRLVGKERSRGNIMTEDMLRTLAGEAVGEGSLGDEEARYISQIFDFGNLTVEEVMTPRAGIFFFPEETPLEMVVKEFRRTRYSKVPVFRETRDNVVGILFSRDLLGMDLAALKNESVLPRELLRPAYFVPETKPLSDLFHAFRRRKLSLALAVDEYGGLTGLVTMEDLLECIFGDIYSASDLRWRQELEPLDEGGYLVPGAMPVTRLNEILRLTLDEDSAETVAGLLLHEYGELPPEGAAISLGTLRFVIRRVEGNRLHELQLMKPGQPAAVVSPAKSPAPASGDGREKVAHSSSRELTEDGEPSLVSASPADGEQREPLSGAQGDGEQREPLSGAQGDSAAQANGWKSSGSQPSGVTINKEG